jgi:cation:H+ antiporter
MLPLAFTISGGKFIPMHLDSRQIEEIFLTSAQSIFAVAILTDLSISVYEAFIIFILFTTQLIFPSQEFRYFYSFLYLILTFILLSKNKFSGFKKLFKIKRNF